MTNVPEYHSLAETYKMGVEAGKALSAATVAELRAEVEMLREANQLYSFAMNTAGIDELKRRADAAERRVVELTDIVDRVARCSYSVCTQIDLRGRRWSEAYLDQVLPDILATLTGADPT